MAVRIRSLVGVVAVSCALAACGGGGGGGGGTVTPPGPTPAPNSISVSPRTLSFGGPGSTQTFTVTSSGSNLPAPAIDQFGCSPVASVSPPSSSTLPASYTVTANGNGSCSLVLVLGSQATTLGINVGGGSGPSISSSTGTVNVFMGGTAGSATVTASSGTLTPDPSACANIAAIGGSGGPSPQTFTIAPIGVGSCTLVVVDGSSSVLVPITVSGNPNGGNALFVSPSTLEFASQNAPVQQTTLSFSGNAGTVSINEDDCIGKTGKPKIAFATVPNSSLPVAVTVTPYGTAGGNGSAGSCSIFFTSSAGATQAVLSVIVH